MSVDPGRSGAHLDDGNLFHCLGVDFPSCRCVCRVHEVEALTSEVVDAHCLLTQILFNITPTHATSYNNKPVLICWGFPPDPGGPPLLCRLAGVTYLPEAPSSLLLLGPLWTALKASSSSPFSNSTAVESSSISLASCLARASRSLNEKKRLFTMLNEQVYLH